ncbi:alpha/beta hydrolase [Nocardioidaceae bacterium]|nr:alpha/beta hydrolase [Nocardioidaceae bacterium]
MVSLSRLPGRLAARLPVPVPPRGHRLLGDPPAVARLKNAALDGALSLPAPVVRRLAGAPVDLDGQRLHPEPQLMLRLMRLTREPQVPTLELAAGRSATEVQALAAGGRQPVGAVRALRVAGAEGDLDARLYVPRALRDSADSDGGGLVVYFHGGGHVWGSLDSHDPACRHLAEESGHRVLAVDYRLAPEHPYPAAVEDCFEAYVWALNNARGLGCDPDRLAVAGDSAGGHLAATTALRAAEQGLQMAFQLLIYPVTDFVRTSRSREMFAQGFFLESAYMDRGGASFFPEEGMRSQPYASILTREEFPEGLAPAHVVTAGFDPLRDEGEAYAVALRQAGVQVTCDRFEGMIHGFFNAVGVGSEMRRCAAAAIAPLTAAL